MIQLEKEKINSQKWKTPKQYTGNSLKTLSRRKHAKVQLVEKGFLGVFEFLDFQKQITADKASNETIDLTEEQSEKYSEQEEEESSDSSPEDRSGDAVGGGYDCSCRDISQRDCSCSDFHSLESTQYDCRAQDVMSLWGQWEHNLCKAKFLWCKGG